MDSHREAARWKEGERSPTFIPAHFFVDAGSPRIPRQSWSSWPTWPPSREGKPNRTPHLSMPQIGATQLPCDSVLTNRWLCGWSHTLS